MFHFTLTRVKIFLTPYVCGSVMIDIDRIDLCNVVDNTLSIGMLKKFVCKKMMFNPHNTLSIGMLKKFVLVEIGTYV